MGYKFTTILLGLALLLPVQWESVSGSGLLCKEEERRALLHIKAELSCSFLEWKGKECCHWERVTCHSMTGRVIKLDLRYPDGPHQINAYSLLLNATIFLPLRQLRSLSLSELRINGCMAGAGFESWSTLNKLKVLDLSLNELNRSIISSLAQVSSLRILDLGWNVNMRGNVPINELSATNLEVVNLRYCGFNGSLPYLGDWSSLKALSVSGNDLHGTITSTGLCRLKNLEELDLSYNNFAGNLPPCLGNLSSLKLVDLSHNQFQIVFPTSFFERVTSLRYLALSNNQLEGTLSLNSFSNHTYLEVLALSTSTQNFRVEGANMPFQLQFLELANCILSVEPTFLYSQQKLRVLDLSRTRSKGPVPALWLLENNRNLVQLDLHKNFFTGPLRLPLLNHKNLTIFDISDNNLSGEVPNDIITKLPNLILLNLSRNYFEGPVQWKSINGLESLDTLDLSSNNLTDDIQKTFSLSPFYSLSYLDQSNNKFYGSLTNMMNLFEFSTLIFSNNNISGELPLGICNTSFEELDISNNRLNGVLPDCIGRADIWALKLSANHLEGSLPSDICTMRSQWLLDLSDNKLSGSLPPCSNDSSLEIIDLSKNNLSGIFPMSWLNIPNLSAIDIGKNHLSGELPIWNGSESNLKVLLARDNIFGGPIPEQICQFKYLHILDLSHNNLSGQIPSCIIDMGLKDDNVSSLGVESTNSIGLSELNFTDANFLLHIRKPITLDSVELPNFGLELMSKGRSDLYWSQILLLERMIDLSSNKLVGNIPGEIGQMTWLITLNLSNNHLSGAIPNSVSKLQQLLSLDLSHNSLTGQIPRELTKLTSLEVFSVAYNNLSGPTLDMNAQFATFDNRSYEGNPNLGGPPLSKSCFSYHDTKVPSQNKTGNDQAGESIDFLILFCSFALFFVVSFWGVITVLYFKSSWRYGLFNLVDECGDMIYVRVFHFVRMIRAAQRDN